MNVDMSIDSGYQTLTRSFFISSGAVYLSGKKQIFYFFCLERMF